MTQADGIGVLYFHGAASVRDLGPDDATAAAAGVRLVRHVRPGYDGTDGRPDATLRDIAAAAVDEALGRGIESLVVVGWSGGGPYALAAGALGRPEVRGVGLLAAWGPMDPPDPGLPVIVRSFMRLGRRVPRAVLRALLAAVGRRNPGHVDDIRRISRPWGFDLSDVTSRVPVVAWHSTGDHEVPIAPWARRSDITLTELPESRHEPGRDVWSGVLDWAHAAKWIGPV